MHVYVLLSKNR